MAEAPRASTILGRVAAARPARLLRSLHASPRSSLYSSGSPLAAHVSPRRPGGRSSAATERRADRPRSAQAGRRRQRPLRRGAPRRREHGAARLPGQRRALAHGLSVGHARRRRAEPDRLRAGAGAGPHPDAGAAGGAADRRRGAVLHPRARLRFFEEPRRDAAHLGQGRRAGRRRGGHPEVPPRRDRHPLFARAGGDARPPHRLGDPGAGGVSRRRRSQVSPRAAGGRRRASGRRGGSSGTARPSSSSRPTT